MKLKFKTQAFQTAAVQAVVDCFKGQTPAHGGIRYRLDLGVQAQPMSRQTELDNFSPLETTADKEGDFLDKPLNAGGLAH